MKKLLYYISLAALFIAFMLVMLFLMTGIEIIFNMKLGRVLMYGGFLMAIGLFSWIKPVVKRLFQKYIEKQTGDGKRKVD